MRRLLLVGVLVLATIAVPPSAAAVRSLRSIVPFQPHVKWGGRTVAVAVSPANTAIAIAASESGGLFKTTDGGKTWSHLDALPPFRMSDVKFAPLNGQIIIATTWRDSRVTNGGGIWRSIAGGVHWQKPATSNPPGSCGAGASAFGISFEPGSNNLYVGTDCGVAISRDLGATWSHTVPDPTSSRNRVWAVIAQRGGIVDVFGDDGHHRSIDSGGRWTATSSAIAGPRVAAVHAIEASPLESSVLFATIPGAILPAGTCSLTTRVLESDDGGMTWTPIISDQCTTRPPWVRAHLSADGNPRHFDLYFGSGLATVRQTCTNTGGPGLRCSTSWTLVTVDHADQNDLAFSTASNCAQLMGSDGGVHKTSDCGATWTITGGGKGGFNALQLYEVAGQIHPDHTDAYIGTQDDELWASGNNGSTWPMFICCEGFRLEMVRRRPTHAGQTITGVACFPCANFRTEAHFANQVNWNNPPGAACCNPFIVEPGVHFQWSAPNPPASDLSLTTNTGGTWSLIPRTTVQQSLRGRPQVSGPANDPTIYQAIRKPGFTSGADEIVGLVKITGARGSGPAKVRPADNDLGSIGQYCNGQGTLDCPTVFGVDPHDPDHLLAADIGTSEMKFSTDGGASWTVDGLLTELVTRGGVFRFNLTQNEQPLRDGIGLQVHVIAFDPDHSGHILVGTEAAGIIESVDGGRTWRRIRWSDQVTGITSFFFDGDETVLVSTYGRGLWKLAHILFPPPVISTICLDSRGYPTRCNIDFRHPISGDPMYPRTPCPHLPAPPSCQFAIVVGGTVRDMALDREGVIRGLAIDGRKLRTYNSEGKAVALKLPTRQSKGDGSFLGCPGCLDVLRQGGVIKGFVLSKGRPRALIADFSKLPAGGTLGLAASPRVAPEAAPLPQDALPYLQLVSSVPITGQTTALAGDTVTAYGRGFCGSPGCSLVTLSVGGRVAVNNVKVDPDGRFQTIFTVAEAPGQYTVTASQTAANGETLTDVQRLIVPAVDRDQR